MTSSDRLLEIFSVGKQFDPDGAQWTDLVAGILQFNRTISQKKEQARY